MYERYVYCSWCAAPTENLVDDNKVAETEANRKVWRRQDEALRISTPGSFCEYVENLSKETLEKDG